MLDKFTNLLDEKFSGPMTKLAEQKHLRAVRDGIIATLPLIIVGSFFLIIAFPPLPETWGITAFLKENAAKILLPYRMTMYIMTLYATFGIGYSLSKSYKLDGVSGGILSTIAFMLTLTPQVVEGMGFAMPMANMGGGGMFVGILVSIFAVEILRFTTKHNLNIKMPEQVPPAVARSFESLTPTAIVILVMGGITYFLNFDWHSMIAKVVSPLVTATDTLPSVLILILLVTFFWAFGIHGVSIVGSIARPLWLQLLDGNSAALAAGEQLPHIAAEPFFQWFIWIGGSGCTIGLVVAMVLVGKSKYGRTLGKSALAPSIFNINEPVIFGFPVVLNPILIVPFIITPMVCATIAWFATKLGMVGAVTVTAPWTLPGPIGAFLATNGDIRASILNILLIILSILIYLPFVKMYDNKLLEEEQAEEKAQA
ncbi:MAG: PTS sugar transporter subunit IIC [Clostridium sp.]